MKTAPPRSGLFSRFRSSRGSLNLESTLLIAMLVLTASVTLLSMGDAIACIYQHESGVVTGTPFYKNVPTVVESSSTVEPFNGSVTWSSDGVSGPFKVLRYRASSAVSDEVATDPGTWKTVLATVVTGSSATALDIQPGDLVVVAGNAVKCGGLFSPIWGNIVEPPPVSDVSYVAVTSVLNGDSSRTNHLTGFGPDFAKASWSPTLDVEVGGVADAWASALASDTAYVGLSPQDSAQPFSTGIYSIAVGSDSFERLMSESFSDQDEVTRSLLTTKAALIRASKDGTWLLARAGDPSSPTDGFVIVYNGTRTDINTYRYVAQRPYGMYFGLDGKAYVMVDESGSWWVRELDLATGDLSGGYQVPSAAASTMDLGGSDGMVLQGVDATGKAYFHGTSGTGSAYVLANGTLTPSTATGTSQTLDGPDTVFTPTGGGAYLRFPASANPDVVSYADGSTLKAALGGTATGATARLLAGVEGLVPVPAEAIPTELDMTGSTPARDPQGTINMASAADVMTLNGTLYSVDTATGSRQPLGGQTVVLSSMKLNGNWQPYAPAVTTSPDGTFSFGSIHPADGEKFRFDYAGTGTDPGDYLYSESDEALAHVPVGSAYQTSLNMAPAPTVTAANGQPVTVNGALTVADPAFTGSLEGYSLVLYYRDLVNGDADWHVLGEEPAKTDAAGHVSIQAAAADGWDLRWGFDGGGDLLGSVSNSTHVSITGITPPTATYTYTMTVGGYKYTKTFTAVVGSVMFNQVASDTVAAQAARYSQANAGAGNKKTDFTMPVIRVDNSIIAVNGADYPGVLPWVDVWVPRVFADKHPKKGSAALGPDYGSDWGIQGYAAGVDTYNSSGKASTTYAQSGWPTSGLTHKLGDWGVARPGEWGKSVNNTLRNGHDTVLGTVGYSSAYEFCIALPDAAGQPNESSLLTQASKNTLAGSYAKDWWSAGGVGILPPAGVKNPTVRLRIGEPQMGTGIMPPSAPSVFDGRPVTSQALELAGLTWTNADGTKGSIANFTMQTGKANPDAKYPTLASGNRGHLMHGSTSVSRAPSQQVTGLVFTVKVKGGIVRPYQRGTIIWADTTPPSRTDGVQAHAWVSSGNVTLTGFHATDNVAVTYYLVAEGNTVLGAVNQGATSVTISNIRTGSHSLRMAAVDAAGNQGEWSDAVAADMGADSQDPSQVTGGQAANWVTGVLSSGARISIWGFTATDNRGVDHYELEVDGHVQYTVAADQKYVYLTDGISADQVYVFRMRAVDFDGNKGPWSQPFSNVADTDPPSQVTGLAGSPWTTANAVSLTYAAATDSQTGVSSYDIERNGVVTASNPDTTFSDMWLSNNQSLTPGTAYTYRVRAVDGVGNKGAWSTAVTVTTLDVPHKATGLEAHPFVSSSNVTLSGATAVADLGVARFNIERSSDGGSTWTSLGASYLLPGKTWTDTKLSAATDYSYRVQAVDRAGNTGPWGNAVDVTTGGDTDTPSKVTGLMVSPWATSLTMTLTGYTATDGSGIVSYEIERNGTSLGTVSSSHTIGDWNPVIGYYDSAAGLTRGQDYAYRMRAIDPAGHRGPWSDTVTVTMPTLSSTVLPSKVTGMVLTSWNTTAAVSISGFTATEGDLAIANFRMDRSLDPSQGWTYTALVSPSLHIFVDNHDLVNGATYYYRLAAVDTAGNVGEYSDIQQATVFDNGSAPGKLLALHATPWTTAPSVTLSGYYVPNTTDIEGYDVQRDGTVLGSTDGAAHGGTTKSSTAYVDAGLVWGSQHTYRMRAYNNAGTRGAWSDAVTVTALADTTDPSQVNNLTATPWSTHPYVTLGWDASADAQSGVAGYEVWRSADGQVVDTHSTTLTWTDTGSDLVSGTAYTYKVRAYDAVGNRGAWSSTHSASVQVLSSISGLSATAWTTAPAITLSGYGVSNTGGETVTYAIEQNGTVVATTQDTNYSLSGLAWDTSYSYRVHATAPGGMDAWSNTATARTVRGIGKASGLVAAPWSTQPWVSLSGYSANPGDLTITGWDIQRDGVTIGSVAGNDGYVDTGLTNGNYYTYRVRAHDASGNTGTWSDAVTAGVGIAEGTPSKVTGITPSSSIYRYNSGSAYQPDILVSGYTATDDKGIASYDWTMDGGGSGNVASSNSSFIFFPLTPGTAYSFRMRAVDGDGNKGPWSDTVTATTVGPQKTTGVVATPSDTDGSRITVSGYTAPYNGSLAGTFVYQIAVDGTVKATTGSPSAVIGGLLPGHTYSITVRGHVTSWGTTFDGAWSDAVPVTTVSDTTPPSKPTGLDITSWLSSPTFAYIFGATVPDTDVAGWDVARSTDGGTTWYQFAPITGYTFDGFNDSNYSAGTLYRVRAFDTSGNHGEWSDSVGTSGLDDIGPSQVTGLVATPWVSSGWVSLTGYSATDNVGVTGYAIQRSTNNSNPWTDLGTVTNTDGFIDQTAVQGTTYWYRVGAFDAGGNWGQWSDAVSNLPVHTETISIPASFVGYITGPTGTVVNNATWAGPLATSFGDLPGRVFWTFDTSVLPSDAAVSAGSIAAYYTSGSGRSTTAYIAAGQQASPTGLTLADYLAGDYTYGGTDVPDYNYANLDQHTLTTATSLTFTIPGYSVPRGFAKFRVRLKKNYSSWNSQYDTANTGFGAPVLTVTYTTARPDTTPPSKTTGLVATPWSTQPAVTLSGYTASDNANIAGYEIQRSTDGATWSGLGTTADASYTDASAHRGTTYDYRLRAFDAAGNYGPWSDTATATVPSAPPAPEGVVAVPWNTSNSMTVSWSAVTGRPGVTYEVERGSGNSYSEPDAGTVVSVASGLTGTSYVDTGLSSWTTYYYHVRAVDAAGTSPWTSPWYYATTGDHTPPTQVTGLSADAWTTQPFVSLTGYSATDDQAVTGYDVQRSGDGGSTWDDLGTVGDTNGYVDQSAAEGTSYTYRMRAYDQAGNKGEWSTGVPVTTWVSLPSKTAGVTATQWLSNPGHITIGGWTATSDRGIAGYHLEESVSGPDGPWNNLGNYAAGATHVDVVDLAALPYTYYRVFAYDDANHYGEWSDLVSPTGVDDVVPAQVTGLVATPWASSSWVNLSGYSASDNLAVTSYAIQRSEDGGNTWTDLGTVGNTDGYIDQTAIEGTAYQYRMAARDGAGNQGAWSDAVAATTSGSVSKTTGLVVTPRLTAFGVTLSGYTATTGWGTSNTPTTWWIERTPGSTDNPAMPYTTSMPGSTLSYSPPTGGTTGTQPGTTYAYRMRAQDGQGNYGAWSDPVTATTIILPGVPTGTVLTPTGPGQVTISGYTSLPGTSPVVRYRIMRYTVPTGGSGTVVTTQAVEPSHVDNGNLTEGATYYYAIAAYDTNGALGTTTARLPVVMTTPVSDSTPPSKTTGLAVSPWTTQSWINVSGYTATDDQAVTGYEIQRSSDGGSSWDTLNPAATADGFLDETAVGGTAYTYRVRAHDAAGNNGEWSDTAAATSWAPDTTPPAKVTGTVAAAWLTKSWVSVTGYASSDSVGVTGYEISRSTDGTNWTVLGDVADTSGYTDQSCADNTAYQYRVRAFDAAGNYGEYGDAASATTGSTPQSNVTLTSGTADGMVLNAGSSGMSWGTVRNSPSGSVSAVATTLALYTKFLSPNYSVYRGFFPFDKSSVTGNITAATLTLYKTATSTSGEQLVLFAGTQHNPLVAGDFTAFGSTPLADRVPMPASGLITFVLNQAGLDYLNSAGATAQFCVRTAADVDNVAPTSPNNANSIATAENTIPTYRPQLHVTTSGTYVPPADTTSPSRTTGLAANAWDGQPWVSLTGYAATDDRAVTGYEISRSSDSGANWDSLGITANDGTTGFIDQTPAEGTSYLYRLRALDAAGNAGTWGDSVPVTTWAAPTGDTTPPSQVTGLNAYFYTATANAYLYGFSATDDTGVDHYEVERNGAVIGTLPDNSGWTDTMEWSTDYAYRVRAVDAAGNAGAWSDTVSGTTPAFANPPEAVTGLTATPGDGQVALAWTPGQSDAGITAYYVWIFQDGTCIDTLYTGSDTPAWTVTGLTNGTTYGFAVMPVDAHGQAGSQVSVDAAPVAASSDTPPTRVTGLTATAWSTASKVTLAWDAASDDHGVVGYEVLRDGSVIDSTTGTSYVDANAADSTAYTYTVRAYDTTDQRGEESTGASATTGHTASATTAPIYGGQAGMNQAGSGTGEGYVTYAASGSWSSVHDFAGSVIAGNVSNNNTSLMVGSTFASPTYTVRRAYLPFNVAAAGIPAGAHLTAAVLDTHSLGTTGNGVVVINVVPGFPTNGNGSALAVTDFAAVHFDGSVLASKTWSSPASGTENQFTLNADGLNYINTSGITEFGFRTGLDLSNTAPVGLTTAATICSQNYGTAASRPYLTISYTYYTN